MKKVLSIFCLFTIVALLSACNNGDSGGSSGAHIPEVSWDLFDTSDWVTCYNADQSVITNPYQSCIWNCGTLDGSLPHYYKIVFFYDEAADDYSVSSIMKDTCKL